MLITTLSMSVRSSIIFLKRSIVAYMIFFLVESSLHVLKFVLFTPYLNCTLTKIWNTYLIFKKLGLKMIKEKTLFEDFGVYTPICVKLRQYILSTEII